MKRVLRVFVLILGVKGRLMAQSSEQGWIEHMFNIPFARSGNVELATTLAATFDSPKWQSLDFQVTPEYALNQHWDMMAAVLGSATHQNKSLSTWEIREMMGTRIHFTPQKRIQTRLLVRFEQRNQQNEETNQWDHSTRLRVRAETITALNRKSMYAGDKLWYLIVDAEQFIVLDDDVNERFANRFRVRSGIGYRINYGLRFELLYTLQQSKNTIDDNFETSDHIFRIRIKQYLSN